MFCARNSRSTIVSNAAACIALRVRQNRRYLCILVTTTSVYTCGAMVVDCDYDLHGSGPTCVGYGDERGRTGSTNPTSSTGSTGKAASPTAIRAGVKPRASDPESQKRAGDGCRHKA